MMNTNTLLVIGNGFDITAGAKTQYKDFFDSTYYENARTQCIDWIEKTSIENGNIGPVSVGNMLDYDFNCWDLLFCMESNNINQGEQIKWCAIEKVIHDSLTNESPESAFSWKQVFETLHRVLNEENMEPESKKEQFMTLNIKTKIMFYYLLNKNWKDYVKEISAFYNKLLEELKAFEHIFGLYIREETELKKYVDRANNLVNQLITRGKNEILQIDSFNYSSFSSKRNNIRHINGDCDNPIFGIDLSDVEERKYPYLRCFTKTMRRVNQDSYNLNQYSNWSNETINKAVIYGHSLDEMDYDYFNYLFTTLKFNTFSVEKMGSIEFVYRIYNPKRQNEIRNAFADRIYRLLSYYEAYLSRSNQHILINLLRFSGRLKIREL